MRILLAHAGMDFSVHDVCVGWLEGLRAAGQQVGEFNLHDRLCFYGQAFQQVEEGKFRLALTEAQARELAINGLYAALMRYRPHVLFVVSGFFVPAELCDIARAAGVRVVLLCTESPYEDDRQAALAGHCDLTLLNDPTNIDRFAGNVAYMPHAYRPAVHHPGPADPALACDFAFVGTGYPSRIAFLEEMDLDGLDVMLAGNWQALTEQSPLRRHLAHEADECLDNEQTARVYRSAAVGMNLYRREAQRPELSAGWAMGPREVELAACGAFYLRDPRGEGDELLPMLPTFHSPAEASEQLRWWLSHPEQRQAAAAKARAAVADRTFVNHARRLMRLLEGI